MFINSKHNKTKSLTHFSDIRLNRIEAQAYFSHEAGFDQDMNYSIVNSLETS